MRAAVFLAGVTATFFATAFFATTLGAATLLTGALLVVTAAVLRAGAFATAVFPVCAFFNCALEGNASCTPFLAALERFRLISALGTALEGLAATATAGLAAPSFRRTGLSPQSSSRW